MSQVLVNSTGVSSTILQEYSIWRLSWTVAIVVVAVYAYHYRGSKLVSFLEKASGSTPSESQEALGKLDCSNVRVTKILIHPIKVRKRPNLQSNLIQ